MKETSDFYHELVRLLCIWLGVLLVKKIFANILKWEKIRCSCCDITAVLKELKRNKGLPAVTQKFKCSLSL